MRCCCILIIVFFLFSANSFAQSLTAKEIEDDLVHEYSKLISFDRSNNYDSVDYQDSVFRTKITAYTQQYSFILTYPFQTLIDDSKLTGNNANAVLTIFNYAMQTEKIVRITAAQGSSLSLPVADLHPGIYRIQLMRGNETVGCSFIKQ
jgi:hypothetical protein